MKPSLLNALLAVALTLSTAVLAGTKDDIIATDKAFSELSIAQGSNAAFLAYMTDDARIFGTGNEPPIFGKAEAVKRFQTSGNGDPKLNVLSWVPDNAEVSGDGTIGYSDGHWLFEGAPDAKGNRLHLTGHYVTVWRKAGSGWKVIADIGATDPPTGEVISSASPAR
jgi:ketosteroid isomerase-like protein